MVYVISIVNLPDTKLLFHTLIIRSLNIFFYLLLLIGFSPITGVAQNPINESTYDSIKSLGLIDNSISYDIISSPFVNRQSARFTPPDSSFSLAIPPSDDGSSSLISLPFDFCLMGVAKTDVFINTNGNISFDQVFSSGTPFNMPFGNFAIIAPFWSDVDTRVRGGVYYKILPNALIVNWEDVSHFDQNSSRGNSYQLIITDGTSELLPFGYTVGMYYDKIEWTAGDASGGIGGFGGAPAIIGINMGDGIHSAVAGKFDRNDTTFIASTDTLNGVKKLVGKHVFFNPCDSSNNRPGLMGYNLKDTIGVCVGDTLHETIYFPSTESNQQTYVRVSALNFPGFTMLNSSMGQMASAEIEIVGSVSNMGFHEFSFTVVDNGSPNQFYDIDIVVEIDSLPVPLNVFGDTSICSYDTTLLSVDTLYENYLWNTGIRANTINAIPGNYSVTVSYHNCEAEQSQLVRAIIPNSYITGPKYICLPDTVTLTAPIGNDAYLWSNGDTVSATSIFSSGTYFITVEDETCLKIDSISIEDMTSNSVSISTSNLSSCNGDSVTLSVPPFYDNVLWSNGQTGFSTRVLMGTHYVLVSLNSGTGSACNATDTIIIGPGSINPVNLTGDSLICGDGNTTYQVNGFFNSYLWDNGETSSSSTFSEPGIHSVTVTDGTCSDSSSFLIIKNPLPIVEIRGSLFYCDNVDSARLVAVGNGWDSLFWNTGDITDTIYTGYGWKKATAWKDGCANFVFHPVNELINGVDVQGITEICPGQSTRLDVEFGFQLYQWNTGAVGFSTLVGTPGDYWCVVSLDTCSATTDTITVTMNVPDTVQILGDTVMCDSVGGFIYADLGFTQFSWSTGETTPGIIYTTPGIYSVTVQDSSYCVTSDSIQVLQFPEVQVQISGDNHYCFTDSTNLSVGVFNRYLWSNGDTTQTIKVRTGFYAVTVTNNVGCKAVDGNWRVTSSSPKAEIIGAGAVCYGDTGSLFAKHLPNETILWSTGEVADTIYVGTGNYVLSVTDVYNCVAVTNFDLLPLPSPVARILVNPEGISNAYSPVKFYDNSDLNGATISSWYWSFNDSLISSSEDTVITFYEGMELTIVHALTSIEGCTDTVIVAYEISSDIVKTNIITPNGDGINDYLAFPNIQKYETNRLVIFNRWGTEIAFFENYRNFWDAYLIPDGVYFYVLYLGDGVTPVKGSFTIVR